MGALTEPVRSFLAERDRVILEITVERVYGASHLDLEG
jgi:hypothetical protein